MSADGMPGRRALKPKIHQAAERRSSTKGNIPVRRPRNRTPSVRYNGPPPRINEVGSRAEVPRPRLALGPAMSCEQQLGAGAERGPLAGVEAVGLQIGS